MLVVRTLITQRKELNEVLSNQSSRLTHTRFYRAFAVASVDVIFTTPLSIFTLYYSSVINGPVNPWPGWSEVHSNFSRVTMGPSFLWRNPKLHPHWPHGVGWFKFALAWNQWIYVFCAFVFIAIYGTTKEVMEYYANVLKRIATLVGWKGSRDSSTNRRPGEPSTIIFQSVPGARAQTTWDSPSTIEANSSCVYLTVSLASVADIVYR